MESDAVPTVTTAGDAPEYCKNEIVYVVGALMRGTVLQKKNLIEKIRERKFPGRATRNMTKGQQAMAYAKIRKKWAKKGLTVQPFDKMLLSQARSILRLAKKYEARETFCGCIMPACFVTARFAARRPKSSEPSMKPLANARN